MLNYSAESHSASVEVCPGSHGLLTANIEEVKAAINFASLTRSSDLTSLSARALSPTLVSIKLTGFLADPQVLARATLALNSSIFYGEVDPKTKTEELSGGDRMTLEALMSNLREIARKASEGRVRLLFDAEQSWIQPAIDHFVDVLSQEINSASPVPIIYNTCKSSQNRRSAETDHLPLVGVDQAYLKSTPERLAASLRRADVLGYSTGTKLVRGAYFDSELAQSLKNNVPCPIWPNKAATDASYNKCAQMLETRVAKEVKEGLGVKTAAFFATHNYESARLVLERMMEDELVQEREGKLEVLKNVTGQISFAQLLGMCDNLTLTLASILRLPEPSKTSPPIPLVIKSVPYATFEQAIPYLIRRANENHSILQGDPTSGRTGAAEERKAVAHEIMRRYSLLWTSL
ncbi:proline dehydrogenase, partial [Phenoliferia sp. Uapishka_3]